MMLSWYTPYCITWNRHRLYMNVLSSFDYTKRFFIILPLPLLRQSSPRVWRSANAATVHAGSLAQRCCHLRFDGIWCRPYGCRLRWDQSPCMCGSDHCLLIDSRHDWGQAQSGFRYNHPEIFSETVSETLAAYQRTNLWVSSQGPRGYPDRSLACLVDAYSLQSSAYCGTDEHSERYFYTATHLSWIAIYDLNSMVNSERLSSSDSADRYSSSSISGGSGFSAARTAAVGITPVLWPLVTQ